MIGCLGMKGLMHNIFRTSLLNNLKPYPFILLLRLECVAFPPPPFTNQGHRRRGVELESSLHHVPTVPPAEFKYGEGESLSSSSLEEALAAEE
jgi:hypothetical protein